MTTFDMTLTRPSVYVALASTMYDDPGAASWTDLTSRVISCEVSSDYRDDRTAEFVPGTAQVLLDNADRMVDPGYASSLVYGSAGLPGCLVKVVSNGDIVWSGVLTLTGECWTVQRTRGKHSTCTMSAVTLSAATASVGMPSSPWAAGIESLSPDYWVRGDAASTSLAAGDDLPDTVTSGVAAVVAGSGSLTLATSLVSDDQNPSMAPGSGTYVKCYAADLATSWLSGGSKTQLVASCVWKSSELTAGTDNVMSLQYTPSTHYRWSVTVDSVGQLILTMYDTGGTAVSFDVAPDNPNNTGGRWDDGNPHIVTVKYVGSSKLVLWADGLHVDITASVPANYGEASLLVGSSSGQSTVDEILFWRVAISDANLLTMHGWFLGTAAPLARQALADRVTSLAGMAGPSGWSNTITVHSTAADPDLWGLGSVKAMPRSFGEGLEQTAESYGGAWWSDRNFGLRLRTANALGSASYIADYITAQANLTDEASPAGSPTPIRRGVLQKSGTRSDRLVTRGTVVFGNDGGLGVPDETLVSTSSEASATPLARYGIKAATLETQCIVSDTYAATLAGQMLLTSPPIEVQAVRVDVIDQATLDWVTGVCGLEKMVTVTDTPSVGGTFTTYLNIQGETFTWDDKGALVVTLRLAASRTKAGRVTSATGPGRGTIVAGTGIAAGAITADKLSPEVKAALGIGGAGGGGGSGITALTGDVSASGPGSAAATVATFASPLSHGVNVTTTTTPGGVLVNSAGNLNVTTNASRTAYDYGFQVWLDHTVTDGDGLLLQATGIGPSGVVQVGGTITHAYAPTANTGQFVGFQNMIVLTNDPATAGSVFQNMGSYGSNPWWVADTTKLSWHKEFDISVINTNSFWDGPVWARTNAGLIDAANVVHAGFQSTAFATTGTHVGHRRGLWVQDGQTMTNRTHAVIAITDVTTFAGSGVIYCDQAEGFAISGQVAVETNAGWAIITYTSVDGQALAGCTLADGTGSVAVGATVQAATAARTSCNSQVDISTLAGAGTLTVATNGARPFSRTGTKTLTVLTSRITGAHGTLSTTSHTITCSSAAFEDQDVGRVIENVTNPTYFPDGTTILRVTSSTTAVISNFPTTAATTDVLAIRGGGGPATIAYTGATDSTFTGCNTTSGSGTLMVGDRVSAYGIISSARGIQVNPLHTATENYAFLYGNNPTDYLWMVAGNGVTNVRLDAATFGIGHVMQAYTVAPTFATTRAQGNQMAPEAVTAGQVIGQYTASAHNGTAYGTSIHALKVFAAEDQTTGAAGSYTVLRAVPIGSTTQADVMRLGEVQGGFATAVTAGSGTSGGYASATLYSHPGTTLAAPANTVGLETVGQYGFAGWNSADSTYYTLSAIRGVSGQDLNVAGRGGGWLAFDVNQASTTTPTTAGYVIHPAGGIAQWRITGLSIGASGALGGNTTVGFTNADTMTQTGAATFGSTVAATGTVTGSALIPTGLTGATAASRHVGATTTGAPVSGTFSTGDWVTTQAGGIYICTAGGSPGTWAAVSGSAGAALLIDGTVNTSTAGSGTIIVNQATSAPLLLLGVDKSAAMTAGQVLGGFYGRGSYDASGSFATMATGGLARFVADGTWSSTSRPARFEVALVASGATATTVAGGWNEARTFYVGATSAGAAFTVDVAGAVSAASATVTGDTVLTGNVYGGAAANDDLELYGTSHATITSAHVRAIQKFTAEAGLYGDTASAGNLTIGSTSHATKGFVTITERLVIGGASGNIVAADAAAGNEAFRIQSTATGDDPTEIVYQFRSQTTDASTKNIAIVGLTAGAIMMVEATVVCHRTTTSEVGGAWKVIGGYKDSGAGVPALIAGTVTSVYSAASSTQTCTLAVTGTSVAVQVVGVAAQTYSWHVTLRTYTVDT